MYSVLAVVKVKQVFTSSIDRLPLRPRMTGMVVVRTREKSVIEKSLKMNASVWLTVHSKMTPTSAPL